MSIHINRNNFHSEDFIEKGKAHPIGYISTHAGKKVVKTADGWRPVKGDDKSKEGDKPQSGPKGPTRGALALQYNALVERHRKAPAGSKSESNLARRINTLKKRIDDMGKKPRREEKRSKGGGGEGTLRELRQKYVAISKRVQRATGSRKAADMKLLEELQKKMDALKKPEPTKHKSKSDHARALHDEGHTVAQIANKTGMHYSHAHSVIKKHRASKATPAAKPNSTALIDKKISEWGKKGYLPSNGDIRNFLDFVGSKMTIPKMREAIQTSIDAHKPEKKVWSFTDILDDRSQGGGRELVDLYEEASGDFERSNSKDHADMANDYQQEIKDRFGFDINGGKKLVPKKKENSHATNVDMGKQRLQSIVPYKYQSSVDTYENSNDGKTTVYISSGDRGPRTDHGGGPTGDEWMDGSQVRKLQQGYEKHWMPKLEKVRDQLAADGVKVGDLEVEYGEKGHVGLSFSIQGPKPEKKEKKVESKPVVKVQPVKAEPNAKSKLPYSKADAQKLDNYFERKNLTDKSKAGLKHIMANKAAAKKILKKFDAIAGGRKVDVSVSDKHLGLEISSRSFWSSRDGDSGDRATNRAFDEFHKKFKGQTKIGDMNVGFSTNAGSSGSPDWQVTYSELQNLLK